MSDTINRNTNKDALNPDITNLDFKFEELKTSESIKNNWLHTNRNFQKLSIFLKNLVDFVVDLKESIKPENIVKEVIEALTNNKPNVLIKTDLKMDDSVITGDYIVTRTEDDHFIIKRLKDNDKWITDNMIVTTKEDVTGTVLYPVISTKSNTIDIYFPNGIYTNIKVLFL